MGKTIACADEQLKGRGGKSFKLLTLAGQRIKLCLLSEDKECGLSSAVEAAPHRLCTA